MLNITVFGAAGRMGQRLVALTSEDPELNLSGAIDWDGSPAQGKDAGTIAGVDALGVIISSDINAVLEATDVVIDFSATHIVVANAKTVVAAGKKLVIGTTGLSDEEKAELNQLAENGGYIVFAPNMSVGVNLLFKLAGETAKILGTDYNIEIVEMHHNLKKDAPSGTAERLGEIVAEARGLSYANDTAHGREGLIGERPIDEIGMHSLRGGDVVGDHTVIFATNGERIELTHKASSRDTFAKGALRAAKFIHTAEPGMYDMAKVLGL
jgi:4-hydroxy-tetrahydrodipicolinate reductase